MFLTQKALSSSNPPNPNDSVEIVLGGWNGGKSVIRKKFQGDHLVEVKHSLGPFQNFSSYILI